MYVQLNIDDVRQLVNGVSQELGCSIVYSTLPRRCTASILFEPVTRDPVSSKDFAEKFKALLLSQLETLEYLDRLKLEVVPTEALSMGFVLDEAPDRSSVYQIAATFL